MQKLRQWVEVVWKLSGGGWLLSIVQASFWRYNFFFVLRYFLISIWRESLCRMAKMTNTKFEVEKFNGKNSFELWKLKM
jgi:hypothetical protein